MLSKNYYHYILHSPYRLTKITKNAYLDRIKEDQNAKNYPKKYIKFHKIQ